MATSLNQSCELELPSLHNVRATGPLRGGGEAEISRGRVGWVGDKIV